MAHFPYISMNSNECQSISEDLDSYCEDTIYNIPNDSQHSDFNQIVTDETHWHTLCNSPRDRENSPFVFCPQTGHIYGDSCFDTTKNNNNNSLIVLPKHRTSANKKERKRTQSINSAFLNLRQSVPNVPRDTKVSKIKTLRLAIGYIIHLQNQIEGREHILTEFKPELVSSTRKINAEKRNQNKNCSHGQIIISSDESFTQRRNKGRTGWPQQVWANSLNEKST